MGDFLGQLLARSFDQTEVIRPRRTGLFEPSQPARDLPWPDEEPTDSAAPAPLPAAPPSGRLALEPQHMPRSAPPEAAAPLRLRPRPETPASQPASAPHSKQPSVVNEPPATAAAALRPPPVQPQPTSPPPREQVRDASRAPTVVEQTLLQPVVERITETSRQAATPPRTATPTSPPEMPDARAAADVLRPAPQVEASGVVQSPVVRAGRQAATPTPAASPTIHVTIGRVEVRASSPAEPARRTRPQPPVMSLDEYLEQRGSGGRR